jgi:hypothetical protein
MPELRDKAPRRPLATGGRSLLSPPRGTDGSEAAGLEVRKGGLGSPAQALALASLCTVLCLTFLDNTVVSVGLANVQSDLHAGVTSLWRHCHLHRLGRCGRQPHQWRRVRERSQRVAGAGSGRHRPNDGRGGRGQRADHPTGHRIHAAGFLEWWVRRSRCRPRAEHRATPAVYSVDPSNDPGVCTVSGADGTVLAYAAPGTCVVDADQDGNAPYGAAPTVVASIPVDQALPSVSQARRRASTRIRPPPIPSMRAGRPRRPSTWARAHRCGSPSIRGRARCWAHTTGRDVHLQLFGGRNERGGQRDRGILLGHAHPGHESHVADVSARCRVRRRSRSGAWQLHIHGGERRPSGSQVRDGGPRHASVVLASVRRPGRLVARLSRHVGSWATWTLAPLPRSP